MKKAPSLRLENRAGSCPITHAQLAAFIPLADIAKGESRFEIATRGPWRQCVFVRGLVATAEWIKGPTHDRVSAYALHGVRKMTAPIKSGYAMEGKVSLDGISRRAFTSSILFEVSDFRDVGCPELVNVSVLHVCNP